MLQIIVGVHPTAIVIYVSHMSILAIFLFFFLILFNLRSSLLHSSEALSTSAALPPMTSVVTSLSSSYQKPQMLSTQLNTFPVMKRFI